MNMMVMNMVVLVKGRHAIVVTMVVAARSTRVRLGMRVISMTRIVGCMPVGITRVRSVEWFLMLMKVGVGWLREGRRLCPPISSRVAATTTVAVIVPSGGN